VKSRYSPARANRSPRVRTITFAPCTCPIYCCIPWLYRALSCWTDSPEYNSLSLGSWSSGRGFASSFLQIPPHGPHPCSWLAVGNSQPPQRTFTAKLSPMPVALTNTPVCPQAPGVICELYLSVYFAVEDDFVRSGINQYTSRPTRVA